MSSAHLFVSGLDLRKLHYMLTLAEHRSFSGAAKALNITQPALSRSIRSLEDALETRLFERTTRDVALTPAGQQGLEHARLVLAATEDFYRLIRAVGHSGEAEFRIGMGNVMASLFGPLLLHRFTREHPDLGLVLKVGAPENLYDQLISEEIDIAIGTTETIPARPNITTENVGLFRRGFFVRPDHPLAAQSSLDIGDLLGFPRAISYPLPDKVIDTIKQVYGIGTLNTLFHLKSNHHDALLDLMLKGDTIVFGASIAYFNQIRSGSIVQLDVVPQFPDDMPLIVSHLAGRTMPKAMETLADSLRSWISAVDASEDQDEPVPQDFQTYPYVEFD